MYYRSHGAPIGLNVKIFKISKVVRLRRLVRNMTGNNKVCRREMGRCLSSQHIIQYMPKFRFLGIRQRSFSCCNFFCEINVNFKEHLQDTKAFGRHDKGKAHLKRQKYNDLKPRSNDVDKTQSLGMYVATKYMQLFLRSSDIKIELKQLQYSYLCALLSFKTPWRRFISTSSKGKYAEFTISCLRCTVEQVFMRSIEQI